MVYEVHEPETALERVIARYGWPLPPMAGAEEPEAGDAPDGGADGGEAGDGATNEDGTPDAASGSPSGESTDDIDDDDFDRTRALDTIRRQRKSEEAAKKLAREQDARIRELQAKLNEHEDANRSEDERRSLAFREAQEGRAAAEATAASAVAEAARLRVVLSKNLTGDRALALAKRLVGDTEEELAADADELLASFKNDEKDEPRDDVKRRPKERLKPGGVPDAEPEDSSPAALAKRVSSGW